MHADIQGALTQINKAYRSFEHRGKSMSKNEVAKVLKYGLNKGYKTTDQFSDEEVDQVLGWQICYKSNEPCKHNCSGLCNDSF